MALERGDAAEAARIFHRLAEAAQRRGMPLRAAAALAGAAHAEAVGGEAQLAASHAVQALRLSAGQGRPGRIVPAVERVAEALRQGGYEQEAAYIEEQLEPILREAGTSRQALAERLAAARTQRRGTLPAKCASCGAPLLPDEVEWHDPTTASCPYCGSVVRTTQ